MAAAQKLADMQAAGKIRRIGLTNFDVARTAEMLDAGVPLVSNQVFLEPYCPQRSPNAMAWYCGDAGRRRAVRQQPGALDPTVPGDHLESVSWYGRDAGRRCGARQQPGFI